MMMQSVFQLVLQSSEGFTGARGSPSRTILSRGCWQKALVPCHVSLSIELVECPHNMAAGFQRVIKEQK